MVPVALLVTAPVSQPCEDEEDARSLAVSVRKRSAAVPQITLGPIGWSLAAVLVFMIGAFGVRYAPSLLSPSSRTGGGSREGLGIRLDGAAEFTVASAARTKRVTHHAGVAGVALSSLFFVGSGGPHAVCKSEVFDVMSGKLTLFSSFGASGAGAAWHYNSLVLAEGPQVSRVDLRQPVYLELTVAASHAPWALQPSSINIGGLRNEVPAATRWKTESAEECPPEYCWMPKPAAPDQPARPKCGWAPPLPSTSLAGPRAGTTAKVQLEVTEFVAANYTFFRVWVAPTALSRGFRQTPELTITSWGFAWTPLQGPLWGLGP